MPNFLFSYYVQTDCDDFYVCAVGAAKNWRKNWQFIRDKSAKIGFFILVKGAKIGGILEGF